MSKVMKTMDGNEAAAYASYAFTEVAGIFPITPSSPMAEKTDDWAANGKKNLFGQTVKVVEMQSEAGAAGTVHGSLAAGALTTTYTASQGLLLMIPNMYKIAGELLPGVFHVSARALTAQALSIFGDHSDVMACRQTGFAMLVSNSVQEVMDLASVAHLSAIKGRVPFVHFFDGFRTSHEIQKIECIDYDELAKVLDWDALNTFKRNALNPEHPVIRGTAQNPDIYFQAREASNKFYDALPAVVEQYMKEISRITGRNYDLFNYYGAADAERVIIAMGSACEAIEETIDYLTAKGEKVGLVKVHLFRPFVAEKLLAAIPKTANKIAVLDRTKEPGALGEPLYQDVCTAVYEAGNNPVIVAGRYGLGSKDVTPAQFIAVYENLKLDKPQNHFTMGIVDDVTNHSLTVGEEVDVTGNDGTISCKFWGLGADGTVGANKNSIKIIGDHTDMYAQAYFSYDSKKSGGITQSHLRFGKKPIRSTYLVKTANFVACHKQEYVHLYDMVSDLQPGGTFLLNTVWTPEELDKQLPASIKKQLAEKKINFYTINGTDIAKEIGLGNRINTVLQAAFFKLANIIPIEKAVEYMKAAITKSYGKKGDTILNMNYAAVDKGVDGAVKIDIPAAWANAVDTEVKTERPKTEFVKNIVDPMNAQEGDKLPVSAFNGREDGTFPCGTAAYEKRGVAVDVPEWQADKCIQCNQCSYVCPHASIRPFLLTEEEVKAAPEAFTTVAPKGLKGADGLKFRMQVSVLDCLGCGSCAEVCPAPGKALVMKSLATQEAEIANWDYAVDKVAPKANLANKGTVKGSQFEQPLLEFSGACAGCGETPYAKLVTQLFGDRMYVANATGCSSIWGGSAPSMPYTVNSKGRGPAWANSLFEDNAEFGLGMFSAVKQMRNGLKDKLEALKAIDASVAGVVDKWIETMEDGENSRAASDAVVEALTNYSGSDAEAKNIVSYVLENKDQLVKKSQWIFGGDGWAYDIGYGGLDHVLASGEDVNVLVFDTEVYSNTGGQSSKATPTGAVAQFAASGKRIKKKDLGMMAMSYGYVYVAQVAMGADKNQLVKALVEAEKYHGPSLIIAYAPCINHGLKGGMSGAQNEIKRAVEAGYWHMYRFNPELKAEGKNPFILDSKEPTASFRDFLLSEVRYSALQRTFPEIAEELFQRCEEDAKARLETYQKKAAEVK
ncbi:pyruvate:ferredoxin (flavodoxin) oxidoreductase [Clostridium sp. MD294]|uniref:pyruvate:ferredoxin (flavodoxin) oxidoreductase n=1 Tax=Clostridium sp. MD294 TaxID=97138 RepID=UPI0002CA6F72|nr:pyruvate:ferredoxin (flavodoxin) oxidoreductase [Clostridium sp. MD294]NDO47664.1 pyruvate:ferredoxin (flavodoxin) oxidoreductase [Clostridium sp. MD294]USF30019.1 Pyruvate:ferredoxin oxidoreductase [Clostridium sp. MD294]